VKFAVCEVGFIYHPVLIIFFPEV